MARFEIVLTWPKREKLWAQCPALSTNPLPFSHLHRSRNFPCEDDAKEKVRRRGTALKTPFS
jgi:hypothetical protein